MELELDKADAALDEWFSAQKIADRLATTHKHQTAAEVKVYAERSSVAKAEKEVLSTQEWVKRQINVDTAHVNAQAAKMRYEMAIRRWETARSLFSAGRYVT